MYRLVEFEVLTAIGINVATFWDITACSPYVNRRFGRTYHVLLPSRLLHAGFLLN